MSSTLTAEETRELAKRWRVRANTLETLAHSYRKMGDAEYAADLEQAALDNRLAADELEAEL